MPTVVDAIPPANGVAHEACPELCPHVVAREENFGGLIFNRINGQIFVVNAIGLRVLRACDGSRNVAAIVREVQARYRRTAGELVERTVADFISEMIRREFLREAVHDRAIG